MSQTILYGGGETTVAGATASGGSLRVPTGDLERATGWELKPQGLCQGETCVPIPANRKNEWLGEDGKSLDFTAFAAHLGQPVVRDADHAAWSFGPPLRSAGGAQGSGPVLAPDFTLPDLDGKLHSLSAYKGRKVFLFSWASW
jgi:hypothetical protein